MKWLEVVVLPVSDVDRAKRFYENLGWRLDADLEISPSFGWSSSGQRVHRLRFGSASVLRTLRLIRA
jgi:catechol 2,3-dioxygenase-like lactoylglutathione lyase family enzyme